MGLSINLSDLDLFEPGAPWTTFAELRENQPLHWSDEAAPNHGFWSVTRYHDIVPILRDSTTFTSERFTNLEEVDAEQEQARRSLLETDGSRHRALRRLLQGQFTPAAVAHYETFLRREISWIFLDFLIFETFNFFIFFNIFHFIKLDVYLLSCWT